MYSKALKQLRPLPASSSRRVQSSASTRFFRSSSCHGVALSLPIHDAPSVPEHISTSTPTASTSSSSASTSTTAPYQAVRTQKLTELRHALDNNGSPNRIWTYYVNLVQLFTSGTSISSDRLPLSLHQEVLRACTPPADEVRVAAMRRIKAGNWPRTPHIHEVRFQTIIQNIRKTGDMPTLADYEFVLEQFAATGHHAGTMQVYREMTHLGIQPGALTFGLCLQSVARRLALPYKKSVRVELFRSAQEMCRELMEGMGAYRVALTSVNLDLITRIMKESLDEAGFETAMRTGYGIDLSNPDCPPLPADSGLPTQAFSTAALNTTLDALGRFGNVSKLVQAFEVLTQPLPTPSNQRISASFDDEDDFGVSAFPTPEPTLPAPHAKPNTTSYNILLRYLSRAGNRSLARHYLLEAMQLDRVVARQLRGDIMRNAESPSPSLEGVQAPRFAVNRGMVLALFGEANRGKDLEMMRWVGKQVWKVVRRKYNDLYYFAELKRSQGGAAAAASASLMSNSSSTRSSPSLKITQDDPPDEDWTPNQHFPELDLPLTSSPLSSPSSSPSSPLPHKPFDLDLHLHLLTRDITELTHFSAQVSHVLERTTQRVKERLGRRVWEGRDVWVKTEGRRVGVGKERWRKIVRFNARNIPSKDGAGEGDDTGVWTWPGAPPYYLRKWWRVPEEEKVLSGEGLRRPEKRIGVLQARPVPSSSDNSSSGSSSDS